MTHISEDALLAFALETTETPSEQAAIAAHLAACADCRSQLERLQRDVQLLGGLAPRGRVLTMPPVRLRPARVLALLEAAALLAIGFALGVGASDRARREPVCVSPAYVNASPPADSLRLCAVADATAADPASGSVAAR